MHRIYEFIEYEFQDKELFTIALTHPSLTSNLKSHLTYEKLEFLGDTVLNLIVTEFLVSFYKDEKEGELAKRRAKLVSGKTLFHIAKIIELDKYIILSMGEENSGGRTNKNNLENCLESLIGAIYLDNKIDGINNCKKFIYKYWLPIAKSMSEPENDNKTSLQEWAQKLGKDIPIYNLVNKTGPDHQPEFTISLVIDDIETRGMGSSIKLAQQNAASEMLKILKLNHNG